MSSLNREVSLGVVRALGGWCAPPKVNCTGEGNFHGAWSREGTLDSWALWGIRVFVRHGAPRWGRKTWETLLRPGAWEEAREHLKGAPHPPVSGGPCPAPRLVGLAGGFGLQRAFRAPLRHPTTNNLSPVGSHSQFLIGNFWPGFWNTAYIYAGDGLWTCSLLSNASRYAERLAIRPRDLPCSNMGTCSRETRIGIEAD